MSRLWILVWGVGALVISSGIVQAQSLSLTQTYPDALLGSFTASYTASTDKFVVTDSGFSFTDWYTSNGVGPNPMVDGTFSMTVYISNTGVPLTYSQLSTAGDVDSVSITRKPSSGPGAGTFVDYLDTNSSPSSSSLLIKDGYSGSKTAAIYEFEFVADSSATATYAGGDWGMILTGPENETPGFGANFTVSPSYDEAGNAFAVPEPSSAALMVGTLFMFARRSRRKS